MSLDISCPNCETDEHLFGARNDAVITITCSGCSLSWDRPAAPHCERCGSTDVVAHPVPLIERSRGTQMSITAMHVETRCRICDADELRERGTGHLPPSLQ
ncbi:MAG: hypothetical protein L7T83_02195 [Ilumatobacteraceae bacterium]|nr:hypothetical protein [Ilumatobacteraceae bacterium]